VRREGRTNGGFETRVSLFSAKSEITRAAREVWKLIARGNETSESDRDDGAEITNENDEE